MKWDLYIWKKRPTYVFAIDVCDLHVWKETYINEKKPIYMNKRPIYMKRDLYTSLQLMCATDIYEKRRIFMERDLYIWKETYIHEKRLTYVFAIDVCDQYIFEKKSFLCFVRALRLVHMCAMTHSYVCHDPSVCERPLFVPEINVCDLYIWKETSVRIHECVVTRSHVRHDSLTLICVPWLIRKCASSSYPWNWCVRPRYFKKDS